MTKPLGVAFFVGVVALGCGSAPGYDVKLAPSPSCGSGYCNEAISRAERMMASLGYTQPPLESGLLSQTRHAHRIDERARTRRVGAHADGLVVRFEFEPCLADPAQCQPLVTPTVTGLTFQIDEKGWHRVAPSPDVIKDAEAIANDVRTTLEYSPPR